MDKINKIKQHMAKLRWTVEEKIGSNGWCNIVGYYIKFSRYDWHNKFTLSLTGHAVYFVGTTQNAFDYNAVLNTVHNTAKRQEKHGTNTKPAFRSKLPKTKLSKT